MKTEVKQYNTAAGAVGFLPIQQRGAEGLAVNAVLDVKEETRRGKEDKRGVKEGKRKRRAEPAAAAILNLNQRTVCHSYAIPYASYLFTERYSSANGDG